MRSLVLSALLLGCSGSAAPDDASIDAGRSDGGARLDAGCTICGPLDATQTDAARPPAGALSLSPNGRYLVNEDGSPFLIKEMSAWGLIQALSESDAAELMDRVVERGFNTLMISIISNDTRFAGGPPSWNGISPFNVEWDFSTPNEEYFAHADRVLELARAHGILVLLVPSYLGYPGDASQGWWDEIQSANNSVEKSRSYGEFLGMRYASQPNIVWVAGGDNSALGGATAHMHAVIDGIRAHDSHLWTGHFDQSNGIYWSTLNPEFSSIIDLDGLYAWVESSIGGPQYRTELEHYASGSFLFQLDQSYEHDTPHAPDNEDPQYIRRKNYDGLLSGCAGTSFSPGELDNQCYTFSNWRPLMDTVGMHEVTYTLRLFDSRPWQLLEPDSSSQTFVAGRGTFGNQDYVCGARASDGSTAIAYVPPGAGPLTVDLSRISSSTSQAHAWWYDPRSGSTTDLGMFATSGSHDFAPPDAQDWVLVIDDDAAGRGPPGH